MAISSYLSKSAVDSQKRYDTDGVSTADLEKKVFSNGTNGAGMASIRRMEEEVKTYERELTDISLAQYQGIARTVMTGLQNVGVPVVQWTQAAQTRKLERVIAGLEGTRQHYEADIHQQQKEIQRRLDIQDAASLLLGRYQGQMTDMRTMLEQKVADYRAAQAEATKSDSKAHLSLRMEIGNLGNDILSVRQKRDRASAMVVEMQGGIRQLSGIQDQMYALLQKVQEAELRAKQAYEQGKISDTAKKFSLPKTVSNICTAEVVGHTIRERARKTDDVALRTVQAIHEYQDGWGEQQEDEERRDALRRAIEEHTDANLDTALKIAENPGNISLVH